MAVSLSVELCFFQVWLGWQFSLYRTVISWNNCRHGFLQWTLLYLPCLHFKWMHYWTGNVARGPSRICMSGRGLYFFLAITWQVWDVHVKIKMLRNVIIVCALSESIEIDMCTCDVCVRAKFIYTVHHFCVCVCVRVCERERERDG